MSEREFIRRTIRDDGKHIWFFSRLTIKKSRLLDASPRDLAEMVNEHCEVARDGILEQVMIAKSEAHRARLDNPHRGRRER